MAVSKVNTASCQWQKHCCIRIPAWMLLMYIMVTVYGSLIPFEIRPHTLSEAWDQFVHIRFLDLNVVSRADWIANILLYIPLGFLALGWLQTVNSRTRPGSGLVIIALGLSSFVAFTIEFTQIFFAPRTVSINDLIAEHLGSIFGIVLFLAVKKPLRAGLHIVSTGGHRALMVLLVLYSLAYVLMSLFPFDFILSLQELEWKLSSDRYSWFVATAGCQGLLACVLRFGVEMIAALPLGMLLAERHSRMAGRPVAYGFMAGILLGLFLELGQFLTASGITQGISIVLRGLGVAAGAWFAQIMSGWRPRIRPATVRTSLVIVSVPYLLLLLQLNGWFAGSWIEPSEGLNSLQAEMFLPFYYHYFTSEAHAVASLIANLAMYVPIGIASWLLVHFGRTRPASVWVPAAIAAGLAIVVEGAKVFISGKHPDPTNILIAALAAGSSYRLALWVQAQINVVPPLAGVNSSGEPPPKSRHTIKYPGIVLVAGVLLAGGALTLYSLQRNTMPDVLENALALRNQPANTWVRYYQGEMGNGRFQGHAGSAYDSKRGTILVFGSDTHNEDWDNAVHEFDPADKHWTSHYAPARPSTYHADVMGRAVAGKRGDYPWAMHAYDAVVYDPRQDALVVTSQPLHNPIRSNIPDATIQPTWNYDLAANTWKIFENRGNDSPTFFGGATAYDEARDVIVAYKGSIWELGPDRSEWLRASDGAGHQLHHTMEYDSWRQKLFVFGNHKPTSEIWSYLPASVAGDAGSWEKHVPGGDSPPPYTTTPVAFDREHGLFLLVADNSPLKNSRSASTYVYDPDRDVYRKLVNADLPPVGMNYMMVWHRDYKVFFLITGEPRGRVVVWSLRLDPMVLGGG